MDAIWIERHQEAEAESNGYVVIEPESVLATHLSQIMYKFAAELVGQDDVQKLLDNLSQTHRIDEHTKELIAIGGLCHDIGHGPGSHVFDKHIVPKLIEDGVIDKDHTWVTHEQRSIFILKEIAKQINISEQDTEFICNVIEPPENNKDWRFSIVNNKKHGIDTDKLDYILRDNYMLGLKLNIDIDKIIKHSKIIDGEWSFERRIYNHYSRTICKNIEFILHSINFKSSKLIYLIGILC